VFAMAAASLTLAAQQSLACGAIAFNPSNHAWGKAHHANLADAMNGAIHACNNSCGIYAWSCNNNTASVIAFSKENTHWAVYSGRNVEEARHRARELCGRECGEFVATGNE
jgi:hypothetical protein